MPRPKGEPTKQVLLRLPERVVDELARRAAARGETVPAYLRRNLIASIDGAASREVQPRLKR